MTKTVLPIHGADHCPGGPDPIPCLGGGAYFRAYLMRYIGSPQPTAIGGVGTTNVQARYDWWETSDPSVFEPRKTADAPDPVMSTDLAWSVWLKQPGAYTITMGMRLNDLVTDYKQEWNDSDAPFGYPDGAYSGSSQGYNAVGFMVDTITRIYPLPDYVGDPPNAFWPNFGGGGHVNGYVTIGARNVSGISDNELELAFLEILFQPFTIPPA
ncbi:MAG: hypothetical protein M3364_04500 [Actinomycetota bacterium]|nr:hypothetical protein [Actinomycetota bacterium]